jgi:ubiquinone/menaquinone biosynthesis C-methylase UbiE
MDYLNKKFDWNREDLVCQYDELPLWSAPFGLLLLDNFPMRNYERYLDVACGTGFPLLNISQRIGSQCKCVGIDPWKTALNRIRLKINALTLKNIELIDDNASKIPFPENHFDLITSNLGVNNFANPMDVLCECYRVLKVGAPFCATTNIKGHFEEFYESYKLTLNELGIYQKYRRAFEDHIDHRGTVGTHSELLKKAGFEIDKVIESQFVCRFLNGTTFLSNSFVIGGFMDAWRNLIDESEQKEFFTRLEFNLNEYSNKNGELQLKVPMVYLQGIKK